ncbi:MAG: hypothetical protein Q8O72_06595 [Bacteroidales bacterium]|nr:hypothetical protein [Bacteroidales bacterium]
MSRLLLLLFLISGYAQAQSPGNFTPEVANAYELVLSLRFDEANKSIESARKNDPENELYYYLENYMDFLSTFISENEEVHSLQLDHQSERLQVFEKMDDRNPFKNYLIANVNLQSAVARLKFGEYFNAAFDFNRAYKKINQNANDFPEFFPNLITLGVVHAMLGVVPENYQWLIGIVNMSGTVDQGRSELHHALRACRITPGFEVMEDEIRFYLSFININLYNQGIAKDNLSHPDNNNLLFKYLTINILMKEGKNDQALAIFSGINDTIRYYPFYYLSYLRAECLIRKGNYRQADENYQIFITNFKGKNYLKDAKRKQAWCRLLQDGNENYLQTLAEVKGIGYLEVGIDKEAENEAKNGLIPDTTLLKSRLLFDGGYYIEAMTQLNNTQNLNQAEEVEKQYRMARIAHKKGEIAKAKAEYSKTIEMGKNMDLYYAANSALLLGNIFENEGNKEKAAEMYRLCLSLDFTTYRNSIRGLAKQHLSSLE